MTGILIAVLSQGTVWDLESGLLTVTQDPVGTCLKEKNMFSTTENYSQLFLQLSIFFLKV